MNWKRRARLEQRLREGAASEAAVYAERIKELEAERDFLWDTVKLARDAHERTKTLRQRSRWIWMAHPAHYICADRCLFRLATWVPGGKHGWIVSTVGEQRDDNGALVEIGHRRKYETMVFEAEPQDYICCPYGPADCVTWETEGYNDAAAAYVGHIAACERWDEVKKRND